MTPLRMALVVLAVASGFVVIYTLFLESSGIRLPLLVAALAVLAISLGILGFALGATAIRTAEAGRGGLGIGTSFVAGLCVLVAAGALAGAIVLGILAAAS
ncbi:MAG TPA: hypothetical protein VM284_05370 [Candidatus Limnocylindria bacterium]|nr:hypothetical protein [Candidatus Limnocylindria bacterium]